METPTESSLSEETHQELANESLVMHSGGAKETPASSIVDKEDSDGSIDKLPGQSPSKRLSNLTHRTKARAKAIFPGSEDNEGKKARDEKDQATDRLKHDPAFNPSHLVKRKHDRPSNITDKALDGLQSIGRSIAHPKDAIKNKATKTTAGQLSKAERPYLSHKSDLDFLEAHDNLRRAESTSSSRQQSSDEQDDPTVLHQKGRLQEMTDHRESLRVAWTTARHVRRVRVVPKRHLEFPRAEYFQGRNALGTPARYDWLSWLGYNLIYYTQDFSAQYIDDFDELPFDIDSSRHYIERLVMASAPWQAWAMNVRAVYRWENPKTTAKWLMLYLGLWYTQHMMAFVYAYIIYLVLKNRFYPTGVESLRDSMSRARDSRAKAHRFGELVDRHGRHDWLEPVMDGLGPYIQLQLGDMANMLEVFSNFYHWIYPRKTIATLSFFISCLMVSLLADMAFCMKIVWFVAGGTFFLCWPIASIHPKYRYLVSPFKWVLWDIPTHAEWSFQYLRREAQMVREERIKLRIDEEHSREVKDATRDGYMGLMTKMPSIQVEGLEYEGGEEASTDSEDWQSATSASSVLEEADFRSFRAYFDDARGHIVIFSDGVRFIKSFRKSKVWTVPFIDLTEMRKVKGNRMSKVFASRDQLEITSTDGRKYCMQGMQERDEAFNAIIAFSGLQWQSLQISQNPDAPG